MGDTVRQMFTGIAQHYDILNTVLSFGLHHYWRQQAVVISGIPSGARLLDVCSGTADLALTFARHLGHDGQIVATDFCAAMLDRGTRKAPAARDASHVRAGRCTTPPLWRCHL